MEVGICGFDAEWPGPCVTYRQRWKNQVRLGSWSMHQMRTQGTLGQVWAQYENSASGGLTTRASLSATVGALVLWGVALRASSPPRLSGAVLELGVCLALCYALAEIRMWRRWRVSWLFVWWYREQARLYGSGQAGATAVGERIDQMMSAAGVGSPAWSDIRAAASQMIAPARERVLLIADLMQGRQPNTARYRATVEALETAGERRYWGVGLDLVEGLHRYLAGDDYVRPLIQSCKQFDTLPGFALVTAVRFVVAGLCLATCSILALIMVVAGT